MSCPGLAASRESRPASASAVSQELEVRRRETSALRLGEGLLPLSHILTLSRYPGSWRTGSGSSSKGSGKGRSFW